jgi:uncharacterized membrane protein
MAVAAGITLTNVYTSLVDVPAWENSIPNAMATARQYFSVSNPGTFFRIFSPMNQLLGLASLLLFWKRGTQVRLLLIAAFLLYITGEGMTFKYFYPRNEILFGKQSVDEATLQSIMAEWRSMNWVRTAIISAGVICSALALHKTYLVTAVRSQFAPKPQRAEAVLA